MEDPDPRLSDALLPGAGDHPSYGIQDGSDSLPSGLVSSSCVSATTPSTTSASDRPTSVIVSAMHGRGGGKERVWAVARCCLTACVVAMVTGMMLGYSSATLVELEASNNPAQKVVASSTIGSLFGSLGAAGALFGGLLAWPVSQVFGRQATLMIGGIPSLIGWLLLSYAHFFESSRSGFLAALFLGRLCTGFASGWSSFSVSVYIAETASAKLKGLFGNCNQLFVTIGVFAAYGLGTLNLTYFNVALIAAGIIAVFEILMLFTYETPRWLYSKGKDLEGNRVLNILRGPKANVHKEITKIKKVLHRQFTLKEQVLAFKERATYLPFVIVMMLMFFQQFGGINAAVFYAGPIFTQAGYNPSTSKLITTVAVGLVQIIATFISVVLIDILGRRILLTVSSIGMILSTLMLGIHFFVVKDCGGCLGGPPKCPNDTHHLELPCSSDSIGALAVTSYIILIVAFSLGWGPIPWTSMSELLPLKVRALAGSVATLFNWLCAFIVTFSFHDYQTAVTPPFAWWSFCFVLVVALVFVVLFLPEAKGHTLEEIQENFEQGHLLAVSCDRCRSLKRRRGTYSELN